MRKTTEQTGEEQLALGFEHELRAEAATNRMLEDLRLGIGELGAGRAVQLLNVQPSVLSESVGHRPRRQFQLRWLARLLVAFSPARRASVLGALAELCGLEVVVPRRRTPEQRAEDLERALLSFGEAGRKKLDEVPR